MAGWGEEGEGRGGEGASCRAAVPPGVGPGQEPGSSPALRSVAGKEFPLGDPSAALLFWLQVPLGAKRGHKFSS